MKVSRAETGGNRLEMIHCTFLDGFWSILTVFFDLKWTFYFCCFRLFFDHLIGKFLRAMLSNVRVALHWRRISV